MMLDIHVIKYMMIENRLTGAVALSVKFFGKIWNIFKNAFEIETKEIPTKNPVIMINAKKVDHPAYAQQFEPLSQLTRSTFK